jgi:uncharacterized RDD family membrane protein YckC
MNRNCPQCHNGEISPTGVCLVCGYQIEAEASAPGTSRKGSGSIPGMIEMDYSTSSREPSQEEELPRWRQELSQRLHEIKQKRDTAVEAERGDAAESVLPFLAPQSQAETQPGAPPDQPAEKRRDLKPAQGPVPKHGAEKPSGLRLPQNPRKKAKRVQELELFDVKPVSKIKAPDPGEIKNLIDSVLTRQAVRPDTPAPPAAHPPAFYEGKLILLSRILSGLIDLIVIVLFTGGCIIGADFFSGIAMLDLVSLANYSLLFLLAYFLYSLFFLGTSNQTIGMMITDLRVVGEEGGRPLMVQLLGRCFGYLLSLLGLGIGLLWGLFDRESRCLHDRLSNTRIVRV